MFNFKVMNRALNDSNLSDKAFRMLYTIINYCSLKNSNSVEVHNAHLMMVLNISERWVRKITNELVEKGYITKKVNGTSQNKLANIYTLINIDTTDDKNIPLTDDANIDGSSDGRIGILKNNIKINKKNIHVNNIKPEVNNTPTDSLCNDINKDAQKFPLTDRGNNKGNKSDAQKFPLKNINKINKKYNIHVNIHDNINTGNNIPEVINKNKFIKHDVNNINIDNSDEIFLSNFMKVDNINTGNSDDQTKDLRIKEKINLNNENEMNEERVNEMNNIINPNENDINTSTLEEVLETQALDDNQAFNTFSSFKNKETKPEQERYQRLFSKCKSQIEIWMKTHEYSCISIFDAYFKAIQDMNNENLISVKQWDAAQRCLFQRFLNLRNGYNNYIQNKKENISSNEISECHDPQPPRQNGQIEEAM